MFAERGASGRFVYAKIGGSVFMLMSAERGTSGQFVYTKIGGSVLMLMEYKRKTNPSLYKEGFL